ncbi:MAG: hypothetical protein DMF68_01555 [Acidobacteria bacterium]|nr:MAG: hypothetical protein DMF68_01555 [Acidobacteriota bacterium]
MSETIQADSEGNYLRKRAVFGNARMRDAAHLEHERRMLKVEQESEIYLNALVEWIAYLPRDVVITIVGWYAHGHGLSFTESISRCFSYGDEFFITVCREFGEKMR